MTDMIVSVVTYLVSIAAALAGYYLTGFVQDKWSKRRSK